MILHIVSKAFKEIRRDRLLLVLTLLLAPFFVLLYKLIFLEGMTVYEVLIYSENADAEVIVAEFEMYAENERYPGGGELFRIRTVPTRADALAKLENREARLLATFSTTGREDGSISVTMTGDHSDPYYVLSSKLLRDSVNDYMIQALNVAPVVTFSEEALGNSGIKTEFENYVPGLVVFSALVLMYLFSLLLARENQARVFVRYRLARVSPASYVVGHTLVFLLTTALAAALAMGAAFALGFRSPVSIARDLLMCVAVCILMCIGSSGVVFLVAAFSRNIVQSFLITTFPFMILVFFSGSVYPFPKLALAHLAGRTVGLFDVLPSTHAVAALHKILTFGTPVRDLWYEITGLIGWSIVYFLIGAIIFSRRKLRG